MRDINKIILHCSATREGQDISTETIRGWHVNERGWSDIGYHYVVLLDGTVDKARPVERQGAHVRGKNKGSIGVCYIGGCDADMNPKDTRNEAQKKSLEELITYLMESYDDATLHGHNEFSSKACPSFNVQEVYKELIECHE
jgi:N-acetylmuramoyl-L-alanine amidase